jgi:hypothetical protein
MFFHYTAVFDLKDALLVVSRRGGSTYELLKDATVA